MFTTTRPVRTSAEPESAPPRVAVDMDQPDLAGLVARHGLPLVVLDIARAARQYRSLCEAFPFFRFPFFRTVGSSRHRVLHDGPLGARARSSAG